MMISTLEFRTFEFCILSTCVKTSTMFFPHFFYQRKTAFREIFLSDIAVANSVHVEGSWKTFFPRGTQSIAEES